MSGTPPDGPSDPDVTALRAPRLEWVIASADSGDHPIALRRGRFTVGAARGCDIVLELPGVLPRHAQCNYTEDGALWVRPLRPDSVFVNGSPVTDWTRLNPGDFVRLGKVELALRERGKTKTPSGTLRAPAPLRSRPTRPRSSTGQAAPFPGLEKTLVPTEVRPPGRVTEPMPLPGFLPPNTLIAERYRISDRIAAGGMGEVYKAEHVELGRAFALKVMRPELSDDPEFVKRFKREAVASSRIGHKNIIDITDFGRTSDGRFYYVMELLEGQTLATLIGDEGALPIPRVMRFAFQMTHALGAAHRLGIIHRDLKPDNVMVIQRDDEVDLVKVVDFGIAKVASGQSAGGQTVIGTVVGTPQYMAPEQAAGLEVDARSDVYSLGLVFHEMITGRPAFTGKTPSILMSLQMTAAPPPLTAAPEAVPPALGKVIFRMLAKNPADRPQSTDEVLEVLQAIRRRRRRRMLRAPQGR
jgi:hypothetical protein